MMFSFNTCRVLLFVLSVSATNVHAETVRGAQRELSNYPPVVNLGTAGNYVILSKVGISTVPNSAITGDIGVSPVTATAMTGFSLISDVSGTFSTSTQVTGTATAASNGEAVKTTLTTAISDMQAAYDDAVGRDATNTNFNYGELGGQTLTSGVYNFATDVKLTTDVTFHGSADAVFIIQTTGSVIQAANKNVILKGGAKAENIFWQVAGAVRVGAGAHMEGILLVKTSALFVTGSSLNGRVLSQTACDLQMATITAPPS
jgi:hypothetical protein